MTENTKFAVLSTFTRKVPYETSEDEDKAKKDVLSSAKAMNQAKPDLSEVETRSVIDWGALSFEDSYSFCNENNNDIKKLPPVTPLQSGDLVKIFSTVSKGEVFWQGTVNLEYGREMHEAPTGYKQQAVEGFWIHGLQDDMDPKKWSLMFFDRFSARLERDGKVVYGALEPFFETGTEGVIWSLHEYGKDGYDGLYCLENGDELTVYSTVTDGKVEWEGPVDFASEKTEKVGWHEIIRKPLHMNSEKWLKLSQERRPVQIISGKSNDPKCQN